MARDAIRPSTPRWVIPVTLALSVIGLGLSIYMTFEHFSGNKTLVCSSTKVANCLDVTTGAYSSILGVPVAVWGLVYFVGMIGMTLPFTWQLVDKRVHQLRLLAVLAGLLGAFYLVWVEMFKKEKICYWCTGVHVTVLVLFIVVFAFGSRGVDPIGGGNEGSRAKASGDAAAAAR